MRSKESRGDVKVKASVAAMVVVTILVGACTLRYQPADLGGLYSRAARQHGPERHAIIVIPGILGSRLEDSATGQVAWGAFCGGYAKPNNPAGASLLALPMARGRSLSELQDEVEATEVLDRIRVRLFGLPVQLKAYFQMMEVLGAGGYRDENLGLSGAVDWGDDHFTCFQFPYDFRRDIVENVKRLHEFILKKEGLHPGGDPATLRDRRHLRSNSTSWLTRWEGIVGPLLPAIRRGRSARGRLAAGADLGRKPSTSIWPSWWRRPMPAALEALGEFG